MTLQAELADLDAALGAAAAALKVDDAQAARLMIAGARASLGRIDERFGGRRAIRNADLELAAIQAAIDSRAPDSLQRIAVWRSGFDVLAAPLRVDEPGSLYDGAHLAAALGRQRH